jgi:hypothetical protein
MFFIAFLWAGLIGSYGQQVIAPAKLPHDTTPIELLDYKLTKYQFLNYYGTDDTSRALINMFFRKRSNSVYNACIPTGSALTLIALTNSSIFFAQSTAELGFLIGTGAIVFVYLVRGIVQRCTYTRKSLLYILVDRENGYPVPQQVLDKLRGIDF